MKRDDSLAEVSSGMTALRTRPRNLLLATLPDASLARLLPGMELVDLPLRATLFRPDTWLSHVWFPESCMVSMVATLADGTGGEVGQVGPEGMVGLPVLLGDGRDDVEAMVQMGGRAWCLRAAALREAAEADAALRHQLLRYALAYHRQVARNAVCNGNHRTVQRLARWLLMAHDRSLGDALPMTHDFLAMMLGVRRAGITEAAGALQRNGALRYERGQIHITSRLALEGASCECYAALRRSERRLLDGGAPG